MDVSVIYVNYNTKDLLLNSISSVFEKTEGVSYEIIVVDNASSDGSVQLLSDKYGDKITILEAGGNLGFGRANNLGIGRVRGKYIFLLNPDTLLINNAIKILFDFLEQNPKTGIAGGNLYYSNGRPAHSFARKLRKKKESAVINILLTVKYRLMRRRPDFNYKDKNIKVGYVTGADMMIRKVALLDSGLFDPDFFMYAEDIELSVRLTEKGWASYSVPAARITHIESASTYIPGVFNERRAALIANANFLYYEKVFGPGAAKHYYKERHVYFMLYYILGLGKKKYVFYKKEAETIKNEYNKWRIK